MPHLDADTQFAEIARTLREQPGVEQTMERAVEFAVALLDGCDEAGITIVTQQGRHVETVAATSNGVRRGDELQYQLNEGPCLDALRQEHTVMSSDLTLESRWPIWAPRVVAELDVRSMLAFQLFTTSESLGALNLYSHQVDAFNERSQLVGLALAAHIAVALAASREIASRDVGIVRRSIINQAEGVLMERYQLSANQAFDLLAKISKDRDSQLIDIASDLIDVTSSPTQYAPGHRAVRES